MDPTGIRKNDAETDSRYLKVAKSIIDRARKLLIVTRLFWRCKLLKLSARNQFKGKIIGIEKGVITAKVKVEVTMPVTVTSVITKDSVEELDLKEGDEVVAIVKSTEVLIGK